MRRWFGVLAILAAGVFTAVVYSWLPEQIPTHWNLSGEADDWSSRFVGAIALPLEGLGLWALLQWLPRIDPLRSNYEKFRGTYDVAVNTILVFIAGAHVFVLGVALGWPLSMARALPIGIGAMCILLGNVLPRARRNWWFGVRTPWTLSNDRVWERTHRVAGYLFVALGIALLITAAIPVSLPTGAVIASLAVVAGILLVYSYVAWRQESSRSRSHLSTYLFADGAAAPGLPGAAPGESDSAKLTSRFRDFIIATMLGLSTAFM